MRNHDIKINWSKPYTFEEVLKCLEGDGRGLYCISRIFGENESIIYIGKATNTFKSRLKRHGKNWIDLYKGDKLVRLGTIIERPYSERVVTHAENALIYELKPQQNTMSSKGYTYRQEYIVHSFGNRGKLPAIVDMRYQV